MRARALAAAAVLLLVAGCGGAQPRPATAKAIVRDAEDGTLSRSYRCADLRSALGLLSLSLQYSHVPPLLRRAERCAC
jgi:hypothetical protein